MSEPAGSGVKVTLSELRDARHKLTIFRRADSSLDAKESASRQAIRKLLESTLTKAGVGLDKFNALLKQSDAEMRDRIAKLRAEADAQSSARLDAVHRTVANWRNTVEQVKTLAPPTAPAQYFLLDTASEISATSGITLASTHIEPTNNWAQFQLDTTQSSGLEEVSFGFFWENPSDRYAVVNVDGYLVLNAVCQAISDGGITSDDRHSSVTVDANLHIHELWNQPPTLPIWQTDQSQRALSLSVNTGGWFADKQITYQPLFRGFDLQYRLFLMPPKGIAMFEVACSLGYNNAQGEANFVFLNLGRQVLCPGVLIAVLT